MPPNTPLPQQTLVGDMNAVTPGRTLTAHRKIAINFRDVALLKVFELSLAALRSLLDQRQPEAQTQRLKEAGLALALACLSYDFVGTNLDDSSEELCTIQVRGGWPWRLARLACLAAGAGATPGIICLHPNLH